jgi:hypothetical protein
MEDPVGSGRGDVLELLLPTPSWDDQNAAGDSIPAGAETGDSPTAADCLGRLPAHRSAVVRRYVESSQGGLVTEFVSAYAPELNPVEYLWAYWKQHELAYVSPKEYWQLGAHARLALKSMKSKRKRLVVGFWKQAKVRFE